MKRPLFVGLILAFGLCAAASGAEIKPEIVSLGHDTYSLTVAASNGFVRNTDKLKEQAMEDVAAYCAKLHKEAKIISTSASHPLVPLTGFASAKIVFKALDAGDPELHAPVSSSAEDGIGAAAESAAAAPRTATDALYNDLLKLDDLRKRGILSEDEFQAQKRKRLEQGN